MGFKASGVHAGLKNKNPDMAVLCSETTAAVAGVFTTNRVPAAPVKYCKEVVKSGSARAVVVNSANANAFTGEQGIRDVHKMAETLAVGLDARVEDVLVCSTGVIGKPLPMDIVLKGIESAIDQLAPDGGPDAARAIMTTDLADKQTALRIEIDGKQVTVGGMAKGAGMIEPNMATMLAFLTTDADVEPLALQACLNDAVAESFNHISVDGCQSTNDTVLFLANGSAGNRTLNNEHPAWSLFVRAVTTVCETLALKIVEDGEGATKLVTVNVQGAESADDARKAARAIANSLLVKTSWFGSDPNWGRIIDALGYSGAKLDEKMVSLDYDGVPAVKNGAFSGVPKDELRKPLMNRRFSVNVNLGVGSAGDFVYACDCTHEYVRINSEYET